MTSPPDPRSVDRARRVLGIGPEARLTEITVAEISLAYRRLVRRLHPDTAPAQADVHEPAEAPTLAEAQAARDLLRTLAQHPARTPAQPVPLPLSRDVYLPPPRGVRPPDIRVGPVRYHRPIPSTTTRKQGAP
jgi:hypothetical protein